MRVTILVDSQSDDTARLAEAVARGLGPGASIIAVGRLLFPGELDRARSWGSSVRNALAARKAA